MHRLRTLYVLIGVLLLTSAVLKTAGFLGFSAVPSEGPLSRGAIQAIAIYGEILLGIWLLLPGQTWLKWIATFSAFSVFFTINVGLSLQGQASCGCFGPLKTDPRLLAIGEFVLLTLLVMIRPAKDSAWMVWRFEPRRIVPPLVLTVGLGIVTACLLGWFGSLERAGAFLANRSYSIAPSTVDLGSAPLGSVREADVHLSNWSTKPIRVVGGTATCSCLTTSDLPRTVEPGETVTLRVHIRFPATAGRFSHRAKFVLDDDGWHDAFFPFTGYAEP